MSTTHFFTIFTPVFNAEESIHRVFESVEQQTFKDFEWVIINDGSTDNSASLISKFINEHPEITIVFLEQENSGKHIAWNKAVQIANGKLFVPADADDSFLPHALSFFHKKWIGLTSSEKDGFSGINVLCYDNESLNIIGTSFPKDNLETDNLELEYKYRITGEKWGCIRTDLLKKRLFPIVTNSHYPESYLWFHLAKTYKVICFNEPLRRYYTSPEGIIQGSSKRKSVTNARIFIKYNLWFLRNFGVYVFRRSPSEIGNIFKGMVSSFLVILRIKQ